MKISRKWIRMWQKIKEKVAKKQNKACPARDNMNYNLCRGAILAGGLLTGLACADMNAAWAMPQDGQIVAGNGSITQNGQTMNVKQNTDRMSINWQAFGIAGNETVNFIQPGAQSVVLNRVLGSDPSAIYGSMNANGQVFLLNPNGILFAQGAQVNVGGLVATTMKMSDADFMAGNYNFVSSGGNGKVINEGAIHTKDGGYVVLLAESVSNSGSITTPGGTAVMAAGGGAFLDLNGDGRIKIMLDKSTVAAEINNSGSITAEGGRVILSANAEDNIISSLVRQRGSIAAKEVEITGRDIIIDKGAIVDVSGSTGGGTLLIGGNYQGKGDMQQAKNLTVADGVILRADAKNKGDGGQVVLWSMDKTDFAGFVSARGGKNGGDGGNVEVSSNGKLSFNGNVDVRAAKGKTGELLLDPENLLVAAQGGDMSGTSIANQLATANVTLQTSSGGAESGNMTIADSINWQSDNSLTLKAHNDVNINEDITTTGKGSVTVRADSDADSAGTVRFAAGKKISVSNTADGGEIKIHYNPVSFVSPTDYSANMSAYQGKSVASMLINDVYQLQDMNTNLSGDYALGQDIDASVTSTWNEGRGFEPVGYYDNQARIDYLFKGNFDGDGHIIDQLYIHAPKDAYAGLFGSTSSESSIKNVGLTNVDVQINSSSGWGWSFIGGLVGGSYGNIDSCYVTGAVSSAHYSHEYIGGIAGLYGYSMNNCYSTATVSGDNGDVGGLVGYTFSGTTISNSYSTGRVQGNSSVGGLLAVNLGNVVNSYWDKETSGRTWSAGGEGKTTAQMKQQATFVGWDFDNTWRITENVTYPRLQMQPTPTNYLTGTLNGMGGAGGNAGQTIYFVRDGVRIGSTTTNASGAFSFSDPGIGSALVYLSSFDGHAAGVLPINNSGEVDITAENLAAYNSMSTMRSARPTQGGQYDSGDIPYTVSGNDINVTSGVSFTAADAFTLDGSIITTNAAQSYLSTVTLSGENLVSLTANNSNINFAGNIDATTGANAALALNSSLTSLKGVNINGNLTLGGTTAVASGSVLQTAGALTINGALNAAGDIDLRAGTGISQAAGTAVTATVGTTGISTAQANGNISLGNADNDFATLRTTAENAVVAVCDKNGITLADTLVSGDFFVTAGGNVTQDGAVQVSGTTAITATGYDVTLDNYNNSFNILMLNSKTGLVNANGGFALSNFSVVSDGLTVNYSTPSMYTFLYNGSTSLGDGVTTVDNRDTENEERDYVNTQASVISEATTGAGIRFDNNGQQLYQGRIPDRIVTETYDIDRKINDDHTKTQPVLQESVDTQPVSKPDDLGEVAGNGNKEVKETSEVHSDDKGKEDVQAKQVS